MARAQVVAGDGPQVERAAFPFPGIRDQGIVGALQARAGNAQADVAAVAGRGDRGVEAMAEMCSSEPLFFAMATGWRQRRRMISLESHRKRREMGAGKNGSRQEMETEKKWKQKRKMAQNFF